MIQLKPHARLFEQNRDFMYAVAYRMLGSMSDAEDIVQDAWFRWRNMPVNEIDSPRAWLATAVSRLCIDRQRKRKIEKLNYLGPWLPEPITTEPAEVRGNPEQHASIAENISIALLFLLEQLTPLERAVFILRECFDFAHEEIAAMLDIKAAYSRQLLRRARESVGDIPDRSNAAHDEETEAIMQRFARALAAQDLDALREILSDDIIAYSDGGGRVPAAIIPLVGFDKVTTVFLHLMKHGKIPADSRTQWVNGRRARVSYTENGLDSVTTIEVSGGKIRRIYTIRNPDKLAYVEN